MAGQIVAPEPAQIYLVADAKPRGSVAANGTFRVVKRQREGRSI
jgi:hypothetical protein